RAGRRTERVRALVRDWREEVLELSAGDGGRRLPSDEDSGPRRSAMRPRTFAAHVTGLLIMLGVLGGELPEEAAEPGAARVLEDPELRTLVGKARDHLLRRVHDLLATDAARFTDRLAAVDATTGMADRLRAALSAGATG